MVHADAVHARCRLQLQIGDSGVWSLLWLSPPLSSRRSRLALGLDPRSDVRAAGPSGSAAADDAMKKTALRKSFDATILVLLWCAGRGRVSTRTSLRKEALPPAASRRVCHDRDWPLHPLPAVERLSILLLEAAPAQIDQLTVVTVELAQSQQCA